MAIKIQDKLTKIVTTSNNNISSVSEGKKGEHKGLLHSYLTKVSLLRCTIYFLFFCIIFLI